VEHISVRDDISLASLSDEFVLAGLELVVFVVKSGPVLLADPGDLGSGGEDESDTLLVEYSVNYAIVSALNIAGQYGHTQSFEPESQLEIPVIRSRDLHSPRGSKAWSRRHHQDHCPRRTG
jgi:hypothetical protein